MNSSQPKAESQLENFQKKNVMALISAYDNSSSSSNEEDAGDDKVKPEVNLPAKRTAKDTGAIVPVEKESKRQKVDESKPSQEKVEEEKKQVNDEQEEEISSSEYDSEEER